MDRHRIERALQLVGSIAFGICAIPAAYSAIANQYDGSDPWFLAVWFLGEACLIVWATLREEWLMLLNYYPNFICLLIMMYYNGGM